MKRYILYVLALLFCKSAVNQNLTSLNFLPQEEFFINPAIAGTNTQIPLTFIARQQWLGFGKKAPRVFNLSLHGIKEVYGMGIKLISERYGNTTETSSSLAYAYHINTGSGSPKVSIGAAIKAVQFTIDESQFNYFDADDPILIKGKESALVPNIDLGLLAYTDQFSVGISVNQLLASTIKIGSEENKQQRSFHIHGNYQFKVENYVLKPSLFVHYPNTSKISFSTGIELMYNQTLSGGIYYRNTKDIVFLLLYRLNNYQVGYSYNYTTGVLRNFQSGSHEIFLGMLLKSNTKPKSLI